MPEPDLTPDAVPRGRSALSRFAVPYTFSPDLPLGEALLAVVGCLARIFGACLLFAVWGGLSAWAWSSIPSGFWRGAAVLPLILLFAGGLAILLMTISAVEKRFSSHR